jgi:hypothetical protein
MLTRDIPSACPDGLEGIDSPDADVDSLVLDVFAASPPAQKEHIIAELVGKIYRDAPLVERSQLLEHLLKPLGVLSFITVANGIFARFRFSSEWPHLKVQPDDLITVQARDVVALVDYVQQVSAMAIDNLVHLIAREPRIAGSAAAAVLLSISMMRSRHRRAND